MHKRTRVPRVLERFSVSRLTADTAPGLSSRRGLHLEPHNPRSRSMACLAQCAVRALAGRVQECPGVFRSKSAPGAPARPPPDMQTDAWRFLRPAEDTLLPAYSSTPAQNASQALLQFRW